MKKITKLKKEATKGKVVQDYKNNLFNNNTDMEMNSNKSEEAENLERVRIMKPEKLFEDFENIQKANFFRYAVRKFEIKDKKE